MKQLQLNRIVYQERKEFFFFCNAENYFAIGTIHIGNETQKKKKEASSGEGGEEKSVQIKFFITV